MEILAQLTNPVLPPQLGNLSPEGGGPAFGKIVSSLVGLLFILAFLMSLFYLLTGGVAWITSEGDKANLEKARNKITHAIVGLIVVAAAFAIFRLVGQFFGLDIGNIPFPTIQ
ncbi:hypothetical protein HYV22_03710 [Candidatus Gottesmanbacteria bacterium]|nr:hypothetical protein [Candidatus Gottesmanbacteria bacterium]